MPSQGRLGSVTAARVGRRRALLAGGIGAAAFAIACGGDSPREGSGDGSAGDPGAQSTQTAEDQPAVGGVVSQPITADLASFDLHQSTSYTGVWPVAPCFNQLIQFDPSKPVTSPHEILPDLAGAWEQPDPLTLVFTLKPGVTYHDGGAFSSQDARAQLEWIQRPPEGKLSPRRNAMLAVDAIETPDPTTLRIRLTRPAPSLLINLAGHLFAIGQARDILTNGEVSARLIGTGPFKLKSYQRAGRLELERNPEYHVPGRPYLAGLTFSIVADYTTALANLIGGQYQLFFDHGFKPADQERVKLETGGRVEAAPAPSMLRDVVVINRRHRPFDDARVRQAISLSLDRDTAIKVIKQGAGRRGGYMPPNGVWAISEGDLKRFEGYDRPNIEKARQLLQQAGVATPLDASLTTRTELQSFAEFVKDQLGKIGINVRLTLTDVASAQSALQRGDFDLGPWLFAINLDDPDATFGDLATTNAARNWSGFSDPQVDALFEKQTQMLNFDERRKTVQDLERQALSNYAAVVMFFEDLSYARDIRLHDFVWQESLYTNRRMENVWLRS